MKKYINITTIAVIIMIGVLMFWPRNKVNKTGTGTIKMEKINEFPQSAGVLRNNEGTINWQVTEKMDKTKAAVYQINNTIWDVAPENGFVLDKNLRKLEWTATIENKKQIDNSQPKNIEEIKKLFLITAKRYVTNPKIEMRVEETEYRQFLYPWWVTSSQSKADAVAVKGRYYIENQPIVSFEGEPVEAVYSLGGKLLKLQMLIPFSGGEKIKEVEVKSKEEIEKANKDEFKIWSISGDEKYELEVGDETVKSLNANEAKLVYVYDPKATLLLPYYMVTGSARVNTGPVQVTLILPASKK